MAGDDLARSRSKPHSEWDGQKITLTKTLNFRLGEDRIVPTDDVCEARVLYVSTPVCRFAT